MLDPQAEFDLLMQRVRAGAPEAAQEVFDRYNHHIRRVVRRHLHQRLRPQFDSADFLQSVWKSFFQEPQQYTFRTPQELINFLAAMAHNKVVDVSRQRLGTIRYNRRQEQSLTPRPDNEPGEEPPGKEPTPSQVVIAKEQWERLLAGQPPQYQQALELLRQGHSQREVADFLGLPTKRLQRLLKGLRLKLDLP